MLISATLQLQVTRPCNGAAAGTPTRANGRCDIQVHIVFNRLQIGTLKCLAGWLSMLKVSVPITQEQVFG